jgi:RNA polymerase sigma factor (sigma-70 family)
MGTHVEPLDRRSAIPLPSAALAALSDVALARRVLGGQERPFELLYDRYKHPLYRYCAAFLRHPEDAEDALQAAMVNAFRALARGIAGELAVRPWLYRIAYRECLNVLSRRAGHQELTGAEVAPGASVAERAEHSEQVRQLAADLADLAPRARQALLLRELAGLSHTEIGIALDTSPSVARNLVCWTSGYRVEGSPRRRPSSSASRTRGSSCSPSPETSATSSRPCSPGRRDTC